jgi:hypothetical protein
LRPRFLNFLPSALPVFYWNFFFRSFRYTIMLWLFFAYTTFFFALFMLVTNKKWITRHFPFGYYETFTKRSNQAVRWKKNHAKKKTLIYKREFHKTLLKLYYRLELSPLAAQSASRLVARDITSIKSTKPYCQFTLMTRSLVPHVKISKHAFKELSREGFMLTIKKP